ncbi:phosphatase PAP2 family protein [Streptomyces yokosukanensis]|uniref:phosphatase PAP2 family protein n=1 Tax=Streptomyces yokosukanensis TaxID=67386 RepID=UPI000D16B768
MMNLDEHLGRCEQGCRDREGGAAWQQRLARGISTVLGPAPCVALVTVLTGWQAERLAGVFWGAAGSGVRRRRSDVFHRLRQKPRVVGGPGPVSSAGPSPRRTRCGDLGRHGRTAAVRPRRPSRTHGSGGGDAGHTGVPGDRHGGVEGSVHTTVSCGGLVVLAIGQGAWACLGLPLIGLIGWSRVRVGAHTPAQTVVGSLSGAAIGGLVFACAR